MKMRSLCLVSLLLLLQSPSGYAQDSMRATRGWLFRTISNSYGRTPEERKISPALWFTVVLLQECQHFDKFEQLARGHLDYIRREMMDTLGRLNVRVFVRRSDERPAIGPKIPAPAERRDTANSYLSWMSPEEVRPLARDPLVKGLDFAEGGFQRFPDTAAPPSRQSPDTNYALYMRYLRDRQKAEKHRSPTDQKMDGTLFDLVYQNDLADTSQFIRERLHRHLRSPFFKVDEQRRLGLSLRLHSASAAADVEELIQSLDGIVEASYGASMSCRIRLQDVRKLAESPLILRLDLSYPPIH